MHETEKLLHALSSVNAQSSTKLNSDVDNLQYGSQYLVVNVTGNDQTTQASHQHLPRHANVLAPSLHKLDLAESNSLSSSSFSIRKHSHPLKKMSQMRRNVAKDRANQITGSSKQTLAQMASSNTGELSFRDPEQLQFQSLIILGSKNAKHGDDQDRLDGQVLNRAETSAKGLGFLLRDSSDKALSKAVSCTGDTPDEAGSSVSKAEPARKVVQIRQQRGSAGQAGAVVETIKTSKQDSSLNTGQTFYQYMREIGVASPGQKSRGELATQAREAKANTSNKASLESHFEQRRANAHLSFGMTPSPKKESYEQLEIDKGDELTRKNRALFINKGKQQITETADEEEDPVPAHHDKTLSRILGLPVDDLGRQEGARSQPKQGASKHRRDSHLKNASHSQN